MGKRFTAHDKELDDLRDRVSALESSSGKQDTQLGSLSTAVAMAATDEPTPIIINDADFNRAPDSTIVRVRSSEAVSLKNVTEHITTLLVEMSITLDDVKITGAEPGRYFAIQFLGTRGLATARVGKFLGLMRGPSGWRNFSCKSASNVPAKLFFNMDKN